MGKALEYRFQQIHIDVARNSTDDFNPFHDPYRFGRIVGSPYSRPIVLGFQLECLCDFLTERQRDCDRTTAADPSLGYRNVQFTFADALECDETCEIEVRPTVHRAEPAALSNRVLVRKNGRAMLLGQIRDSTEPLVTMPEDLKGIGELRQIPDRSILPGTAYFLKRKFLNTANAKNFLAGALANQAYYFDEIDEKVRFPPLFPCALASCALLEKAWSEHHDFTAEPMVYVAHAFTVDRPLADSLRSNDVLHILASGPTQVAGSRSLGGTDLALQRYRCLGFVRDEQLLYAAEIDLASLQAIAAARLSTGAST